MSKNSRIKTKHSRSAMLGTTMPLFIEKGKTKKAKSKKVKRERREQVRQINKNVMNFNRRTQR